MSTSTDPTPSEAAVADEEVAGSRPVACWSVREGNWRDELPDDVAALLAPPLIVSAEASAPAGRRPSSTRDHNGGPAVTHDDNGGPAVTHDHNGGPAAYDPRHAAPDDTTPRFLAAALPLRLRHRRPAHAA